MRRIGLGLALLALAGCARAPLAASFALAPTPQRIMLVGHLRQALQLNALVKPYVLADVHRLVVTASAGGQTVASQTLDGTFTSSSTIAFGNLAPETVYTVQLAAYSDAGVTLISSNPGSVTTVDTRADGTGAISDVLNANFNLTFQAKPIALSATLPITATQVFDSVTVDLSVGGTSAQNKNVVGPWFGGFTVTLTDLRPNTSYLATVTGKKAGSSDVVKTQAFTTPALDNAGTNDQQAVASVSL